MKHSDLITHNISHAERTIPRLQELAEKYTKEGNIVGVRMAADRVDAYRFKLSHMKRTGTLPRC